MKIINKIPMLALLLLASIPTITRAVVIDVDFTRVTNNNVESLASQLDLDIYDAAMANAAFGTTLTVNQVLFAYSNNVGIASNIAEVYIDDGTVVFLDSVLNSLGGFTDFNNNGMANPGDLPGGNTVSPPFVATQGFSADVLPGPPPNGIDASDDILGIVYDTTAGIAGIQAALDDGSLRVGLHVRSIGVAGGSDSYVNTSLPPSGDDDDDVPPEQIPEPNLLALFGVGLAGIGVIGIRRRQKKTTDE